jgi:hypothetical protein
MGFYPSFQRKMGEGWLNKGDVAKEGRWVAKEER